MEKVTSSGGYPDGVWAGRLPAPKPAGYLWGRQASVVKAKRMVRE